MSYSCWKSTELKANKTMNECTMIKRGIPYSYRYDYDMNSHQFVFKSISKIYSK